GGELLGVAPRGAAVREKGPKRETDRHEQGKREREQWHEQPLRRLGRLDVGRRLPLAALGARARRARDAPRHPRGDEPVPGLPGGARQLDRERLRDRVLALRAEERDVERDVAVV